VLIYYGIQRALAVKNKDVLCIDIGGGSSEFLFGKKGEVDFAESIKIGAVRLSKKFFPDYIVTEQSIKNCSEYAEEQIRANKNINFNITIDEAVGSSGTMQSAAWMIAFPRKVRNGKSLNGFSFTSKQLMDVTELILNCKTLEERKQIKGIELKRADILPAGLIILNKVFQLFNLKRMTISEYALREGIISEMLTDSQN
jgi:exopolyphosphatase/guanosine-5'-triphosphate,3'-diphosphate pyrophosphatase